MSRVTLCLSLVLLLAITVQAGLRSRRQAVSLIIPGFKKLAHGVSSGNAILVDSKRILIKGLRYDGAGPDAYFWTGKGTPDSKGQRMHNELGASDVLRGYDGTRDIELVLPGALTFSDVDYISIYCVAFDEDFGHITIPAGLALPEYTEA